MYVHSSFCLLVAGMALAVRIGDPDSPIVECITIPSPVVPTTSPSATVTPGVLIYPKITKYYW